MLSGLGKAPVELEKFQATLIISLRCEVGLQLREASKPGDAHRGFSTIVRYVKLKMNDA